MVRALIIAGVASFALGSGALAADLPNFKGPPVYAPPPPPSLSWTGFYIGVNAGYGFDPTRFDAFGPAFLAGSSIPAGGFIGGGQVGFNYEFPEPSIAGANFVIGGEADFDGSTVQGSEVLAPPITAMTGSVSTKLDWLGTARARLGLAFGNVLPYVTGGFAYAHESVYQSGPGPGGLTNWSIGSTPTGWAAGGGLEYAFTRNLSFKTEYLYVDLSSTAGLTPGDVPPAFHTTRSTLNVVRAGLDWKFDWSAPPTPVVSKY